MATAIAEIVVTAEKVDKALQRSALAVTALPARSLERQQVTDLKSIATLIPNLQIGLSSTQASFDLAMRGIVSTNRTEIGDAAVAFHVDGFYSPRPQGATLVIYTPAGFAACGSLVFFAFFAFAKQAFCNYYFMILGFICCAVAALHSPRHSSS